MMSAAPSPSPSCYRTVNASMRAALLGNTTVAPPRSKWTEPGSPSVTLTGWVYTWCSQPSSTTTAEASRLDIAESSVSRWEPLGCCSGKRGIRTSYAGLVSSVKALYHRRIPVEPRRFHCGRRAVERLPLRASRSRRNFYWNAPLTVQGDRIGAAEGCEFLSFGPPIEAPRHAGTATRHDMHARRYLALFVLSGGEFHWPIRGVECTGDKDGPPVATRMGAAVIAPRRVISFLGGKSHPHNRTGAVGRLRGGTSGLGALRASKPAPQATSAPGSDR